MSDLPEGWVSSVLQDLIGPGGVFSDGDWIESKDQDPEGQFRLLQLADVGDGKFLNRSNRFVNEEKFELLRCTELQQGDVLIARMPDPLGRACMLPQLSQRCITVVDVAIVRPGTHSVDNKWLMHWINSPIIRQWIDLEATGTTRRRIARGKLANLELPIPPLLEQKRIVDKLDSLLSRVDSCRERLDRVPAILNRFRQSVLAAATSGQLTEGWRKQRGIHFDWASTYIDEVATDIRYGTSKKCLYEPKATPVIRIPNVVSGVVSIDDLKYAQFEENDLSTLCLQEDDILMIRSNGSVELVGRTAIVTNIGVGFLYAGYLIRIRIDQQKANAKFVNLCLSSPICRNTIEQIAKSTSGVNNINAKEIKKLEIPLPSLEEQDEIVRRVSELLMDADEFDARFNLSVQIAERLSSSILKLAFRGELVSQDANDEPADILLERIRKLRDKNGGESKKKGRSKMTRTTRKSNGQIRQLTAVLQENGGVMTPEKLLDAAGYTDESIEDFYLALKKSIADGAILDPRDHHNQIVMAQAQT